MAPAIIKSTIQSCLLNAISNIIAQFIKLYRAKEASIASQVNIINWTPVLQFVFFTALNGPPNFLWQSYLENSFPSYYDKAFHYKSSGRNVEKTEKKIKPRLSLLNTLIKFVLDQTLGACVNTILFSLIMAGFRGASFDEARITASKEFWPVMTAGWKLWPAISLLNFGVVKTVEGRTLIGSIAGMAWGIYLSLIKS